MSTITIAQGDITTFPGDAIVNAANAALSGGGGVDGAIHRAAGPELLRQCRTLGRCPPGAVRVTAGYQLPVKHVIHAVGPVWYGGHKGEADLLQAVYKHALDACITHDIHSVAFPNISCGVYRFPKQQAAEICLTTLRHWLLHTHYNVDITIMCFADDLFRIHQQAHNKMHPNIGSAAREIE